MKISIPLRKALLVFLLCLPLFIVQCNRNTDDEPLPANTDPVEYDDTPYRLDIGDFPEPDFADNPLTEQGVALGRMLFYEKMLSSDNSISCASCHKQEDAFNDIRRFSAGVNGALGKRQAMSIFNMAWHSNEFFWDGRAHLLRDQSLLPIQDPLEMNETLENVEEKLATRQDYKDQFVRAFGEDVITSERISLALEQFMNSIVSNQSKYDQYLAGQTQLTAAEDRGRQLYFTEYNAGFPDQSGADCVHCHGGVNFENDQYMNNGLDTEADQDDFGRELATGDTNDRAKFKVPSLRNIELTPPYMHDGRFNTLEEVIDHYNDGVQISPTVDPAIEYTTYTTLMLSEQDKQDLIAFLKTLTDPTLAQDERYSNPFEE